MLTSIKKAKTKRERYSRWSLLSDTSYLARGDARKMDVAHSDNKLALNEKLRNRNLKSQVSSS